MSVAKRCLRLVLGDYELYRIFEFRPRGESPGADPDIIPLADVQALRQSADPEIASLAAYAGADAHGFGIRQGDDIACACWYWHGERYRAQRNFWPLQAGEAKLVQITTAQRYRGRGLAPRLLGASAQAMAQAGFTRLYARIWHSNTPSLRAFEAARWREIAFVATCHPFGSRRELRYCRRRS